MTTLTIRDLAGQYRISPEKREQILRYIYKYSGKYGLQSFVRALGSNSVNPFLKWAEKDCNNKSRSRRKQKLLLCRPPAPPRPKDYCIGDLFEELSTVNGGCKLGKQGGKRNIYSGQAWDALHRGGK